MCPSQRGAETLGKIPLEDGEAGDERRLMKNKGLSPEHQDCGVDGEKIRLSARKEYLTTLIKGRGRGANTLTTLI